MAQVFAAICLRHQGLCLGVCSSSRGTAAKLDHRTTRLQTMVNMVEAFNFSALVSCHSKIYSLLIFKKVLLMILIYICKWLPILQCCLLPIICLGTDNHPEIGTDTIILILHRRIQRLERFITLSKMKKLPSLVFSCLYGGVLLWMSGFFGWILI